MRRSIAVLMLLIFGSFVSAPLLAASSPSEDNIPVCCRRAGAHHCMSQRMMEQALLRQPGTRVSAPLEQCPLFPKGNLPNTVHEHLATWHSGGLLYAITLSPAARVAQTEVHRRISFDRSRQKRGPPASPLLS
jgi:hypothetical protein